MNVVVISGGLGGDPQVRSTQGGTTVMSFSVAVGDRRRNGQTGEWEDVTHWVDVVLFGKRAESLSRFLRKGMKVVVSGRLSQSRWEDKSGNKRSKLEVVATDVELPPKPKGDSSGYQYQQDGGYGQQGQYAGNYADQQQYATQNAHQQAYAPQQPQQGGFQQPDVYDSDMPF